jgi:hypothetical protein
MTVRHWLFLISMLYTAALVTPAFGSDQGSTAMKPILGYTCLLSLPFAWVFPGWWANGFLLVGCIKLARRRWRTAQGLGAIAALLAATTLVIGLGEVRVGYWLWQASTVAIVAAGIDHERRDRRTAGDVAPLG